MRSLGQNRQVLFALNPRFARAALVGDRKLSSGFDEPSPFVMLLRKHLEGRASAPSSSRRWNASSTCRPAMAGEPPRTLVVELLGRQSNAVLLES